MKRYIFFSLFIILAAFSKAQSLAGKWNGYYTFEIPDSEIRNGLETGNVLVERIIESRPVGSKAPIGTVRMERKPLRSYPPFETPTISGENTVVTSRPVTPNYFTKKSLTAKVKFEVTCTENADSTYQFTSFTEGSRKSENIKMDYEIIGNDSLYLVEVGEPEESDRANFQHMLLHITWNKKKKKKVLMMKGPWFNYYGSTRLGEVVLYRED